MSGKASDGAGPGPPTASLDEWSGSRTSRSSSRLRTGLQQKLLENFFVWYVAYILSTVACGTLVMLALEEELGFQDALYLAVSSVTETGLSSVDFAARRWTTHVVVWLLIIMGSPMLLSIVPMVLRLVVVAKSSGEVEAERRGGVAFFGIVTTSKDECYALGLLSTLVLGYWAGVQALGWLLLWALHPGGPSGDGGAWPALFLATSSFHNAGMCTMRNGLPFTESPTAPAYLVVVMLLVLCGNSCFPIFLRCVVQAAHGLSRNSTRRRVLALLLRFPRTCYTHLFPGYATRWLTTVTIALVAVQIAALSLADLWAEPAKKGNSVIMTGLTLRERALAIFFQSVSTRTAGLSVLDLKLLSPTSAFVFCVCMWVSVCPVVVVMRSTTLVSGSMVKEYSFGEVKQQKAQDAMSMKKQMDSFMSQDLLALLGLFFFILVAEEYHTTETDVRERRFLYILFEFCSAYGTVGLSMTATPWSRSGRWSPMAKLLLLVVMLLGRLRGLPDSIDPTLQFHEDDKYLDEEASSVEANSSAASDEDEEDSS